LEAWNCSSGDRQIAANPFDDPHPPAARSAAAATPHSAPVDSREGIRMARS